jgi:hypothetical protein
LDIWDCVTKDGSLWDSKQGENFPEILRDTLENIRSGSAKTLSNHVIPKVSHDFDSIFIAGGGAQSSVLTQTLSTIGVPIIVSRDPVFSGECGGESILKHNDLEGVIVDVGQTQIKISINGRRSLFQRDLDKLPIRDKKQKLFDAKNASNLQNFISQSIIQSSGNKSSPEAMVLALPCWISDKGKLGGSSYIGMKDNKVLVDEIVKSSGLNDSPIFLLNDAELTAHSAIYNEKVSRYKRTIIITLGFGVGAAILENK